MLALVVVLDQFSRNLFRADARGAFAQDAHARECCRQAIGGGDDLGWRPSSGSSSTCRSSTARTSPTSDYGIERMASLEAFRG